MNKAGNARRVVGRTLLGLTVFGLGACASTMFLLLPALLKLRGRGTQLQDGVTTLDDAVQACRRTGLAGWELVTYAQGLVAAKFTHYSVLNLWDTPARAFERGMGYCTQYNLALKAILDRLGFSTEAVFSLRVAVDDRPDWQLGHTWLRLTVNGETRDVCARRAENTPGRIGLTPVRPVHHGSPLVLLLSHLGMILFIGAIEWRSVLWREEPPYWVFYNRRQGLSSRQSPLVPPRG